MRKSRTKLKKKSRTSGYEAKFEQMVGEYHTAKATLDAMDEGTAEYLEQKKHCELLFASAERFFKQHQ